MPAPSDAVVKPKKRGLKGTCGAIILYLTNFLLLAVGLSGMAVSVLVLLGKAGLTSVAGLDSADLSAFVPQSFVYFCIGTCSLISLIAILGFLGTCCQMKENKVAQQEKDQNQAPSVGGGLCKQGCCSKDACMSCGLDLYIFLTFFGLIILLAASGVGAAVTTGVSIADVNDFFENACDTVGQVCDNTVNDIMASILSYVSGWIEDNKDGSSWAAAQNALSCCGWWVINGSITAVPTDTSGVYCCNDNVTYTDQVQVELNGFSVSLGGQECHSSDGSDVYTCGGQLVGFVEANALPLSIGVWVFTFLTLVCFISALVVRCAIKPVRKPRKEKKATGSA